MMFNIKIKREKAIAQLPRNQLCEKQMLDVSPFFFFFFKSHMHAHTQTHARTHAHTKVHTEEAGYLQLKMANVQREKHTKLRV